LIIAAVRWHLQKQPQATCDRGPDALCKNATRCAVAVNSRLGAKAGGLGKFLQEFNEKSEAIFVFIGPERGPSRIFS